MAKCESCQGSGYTDAGECETCYGSGQVEWWKTTQYQRTRQSPPEPKGDPEKAYNELGLVAGALIGLLIYWYTGNSVSAVIIGLICAAIMAMILNYLFKYIFAVIAIGYVLYLMFG